MKVACLQFCSSTDVGENIATLERLAQAAADQGAFYIQTPEMTGLLQKDPQKLLEAIRMQEEDPVFQKAADLARSHGIWLHIGSTPVRLGDTDETGKAANRAGVFSPEGKLVATYDKIHMFDVDVDENNRWKESNRYQRGAEARLFGMDMTGDEEGTAPLWFGLSICYDMRFPGLYRDLALAGAEILTVPSSFTQPTGEAHWEVLLRARAIENGCYVIAAAQSGDHADGRKTHGHSIVIDPWGRVVGQLGREAPGVLVCDIDRNEVAKARGRIPSLANSVPYTLNGIE